MARALDNSIRLKHGFIKGVDSFGHVLGAQLGGVDIWVNGFSQNEKINNGSFGEFEKKVAMLRRNAPIDVFIAFSYADGGDRPTSVSYNVYTQKGITVSRTFSNPTT